MVTITEEAVMRIEVLGALNVVEPGGTNLGGANQRRVLTALLLRANQVVSVDQLVDVVWPDGGVPARAEHNVRTYVHRLRSALGEAGERVETTETGYRLRVEPGEVDADRFEQLVDDAREAAWSGDLDEARGLLDEALGLWHGRPFDEFADEEWTRSEGTRLNEIKASAVEHRFAALLEVGRHTEVVGPLREAVSEEPFREVRRSQLALALYRSGRQAEALRAIRDYKSELIDETGLVPSPELDELEHQILEHDGGLSVQAGDSRRLGDYELEEVTGEGAFSLVWRGTQVSLGRRVAIKQIRSGLANRPDFIRRFEVEAQTVAALEHPHIVPLYDFWREPDCAYLVMRYVSGGSLESEVLTGGLDEARLRQLIDQIGTALHTAHRGGVIHRDVKSANVLSDDGGNFYLTDFGIAVTGSAATDELATSLSTGSPAYASPEQLQRRPLDARTDVYSFGITLFEAATGRLPFVGAPSQAELIKWQLEEPVPAPSSIVAGLPEWFDQLVAQATAKNPDNRFASVVELMDAVPATGTERATSRSASEPTVPLGDLVNPFKALNSFQESDADDFYGRERLVDRFIGVLCQQGAAGRLLAVVGPSGSGKSSAVRSGLLPLLRSGAVPGSDDWFVTTMMPGSRPFDELESALSRVAVRQPGPLVEMMRGDGRGIARAINQTLPDEASELLVVIDQFEELFTHTDAADRTLFLDGLLAAVREPRARLRIVITIRADFLDGPLRHPQLAEFLETSTVTVSPLAPDELEAAIVEPVRRQGAAYEPGLVAQLMADVGDQPGALPLLQYALTELFEANDFGMLRTDSYIALGGLAGALATRAEATLAAMPTERQHAARSLFGRLVTLGDGTEDTRRRALRQDLGDDPDTVAVIDTFGAARLVVFDHDPATREPTVEIAHEALLRAWPRLTRWLDEDRSDLRTLSRIASSANAWIASGRDDGDLARGARLEVATELANRRSDILNETESDWIAASVATAAAVEAAKTAAVHRDRQQNRRLRRLLAAAAVLIVFATITAGIAVIQRNRASDSEATAITARETASLARAETEVARVDEAAAEQAALIAEGEALAAEAAEAAADENALVASLIRSSEGQVDTQPDLAALLALEANRRRDDVGTQGAVQSVLAGLRDQDVTVLPALIDDGGVTGTLFSADGKVGVTWALETGEFIWFDARTGEQLGEPFVAGPIISMRVSGDVSVIAYTPRCSIEECRTVVAQRVDGTVTELNRFDGFPRAFDASGATLVVEPDRGSPSFDLQVVDTLTGDVRSTISVPESPSGYSRTARRGQDVQLDDEGRYAVVWMISDWAGGTSIHVFDTATGELEDRLEHNGYPAGALVAADDRIITGFFDGSLLISPLSSREFEVDRDAQVRFPAHVGPPTVITPGPSGMIVTHGRDRSIQFWSGDTPVKYFPPLLNQPEIRSIAADESGLTLTLPGGRMIRLNPFTREGLPTVETAVDQTGRWGLTPGSEWLDTNPVGGNTILRLTQLDGDEQREIDVSSVHPSGWIFSDPSTDGDWHVTRGDPGEGRVGIWEIAGERHYVVEIAPIREQLGIENLNFGTRLADGGQRLFVTFFADGLSNLSVWVDVESGQIIAGPMAHEPQEGGQFRILGDESVVLGGYGPLTVLPPGLDGEPTVIPDTEGLRPYHVDPNSGLVLLLGYNGQVVLFDPASGNIDRLESLAGMAQDGAFSPTGDRLAITSMAEGVQLYDVATGQQIGSPMVADGYGVGEVHFTSGYGVTWSADGRGVWGVTTTGVVRYAADPDRWRETACAIAGREFTPDEWETYVSVTEPQVPVCG